MTVLRWRERGNINNCAVECCYVYATAVERKEAGVGAGAEVEATENEQQKQQRSLIFPAKSAKILVSQRARGGRGRDGDSNFGTYIRTCTSSLHSPSQSVQTSPSREDKSQSPLVISWDLSPLITFWEARAWLVFGTYFVPVLTSS